MGSVRQDVVCTLLIGQRQGVHGVGGAVLHCVPIGSSARGGFAGGWSWKVAELPRGV